MKTDNRFFPSETDDAPSRFSPKRMATWFFMLSKRLLLKKSFAALLLVIPILGGLMGTAAKEESGVVTVLLVDEGKGEKEISKEIVDYLANEESTVNFKVFDDADAAIKEVESGNADSAWIFPADLDEQIIKFVDENTASANLDASLVKVVVKDDGIVQFVVREKLYGALFPYVSSEVSGRFAAGKTEKYAEFDKEKFDEFVKGKSFDGKIVEFIQSGSSKSLDTGSSYLTSPVRGIAALAALLCTLSSALFCMEDEKRGFFSRIPGNRRLLIIFASNLAAALFSSLVMLPSLALAGVFTDVLREVPAALVFAIASAAFSTLMCRIFSSPFALGTAIPPTIMVMAVVCPVFISVRIPYHLELLFPVTYAVRSVRTPRYLLISLAYAAVLAVLAWGADRIRQAKR